MTIRLACVQTVVGVANSSRAQEFRLFLASQFRSVKDQRTNRKELPMEQKYRNYDQEYRITISLAVAARAFAASCFA